MGTKILSIDFAGDNILVACVNPGWVRTGLGGPQATMEVKDSATHLIETISKYTADHNGGFYNWDGKKIEW